MQEETSRLVALLAEATAETNSVQMIEALLADKRSENTRRAYRYDLADFFGSMYGGEPTPERLKAFLSLATPQMVSVLLAYKARLIAEKRSEATVNRRLASIRSLVGFAQRIGLTQADPGEHIEGEKVVAYRDTRGVSIQQARQLLRVPDRSTRKGRRDFALLLLLLENALRRAEIVTALVRDFDSEGRALQIRGKGRGTQQERVTLSQNAVKAIEEYLALCAHAAEPDAPLFINVSRSYYGRGLTPDGLYKLVQELSKEAGVKQPLSPHRLRHTAITMALDASGGDLRKVQRLSRHARLNTLQIYDDNRTDFQGEMSNLLSSILSDTQEQRP